MIGRFSGSYAMKRIVAPQLLSLFAFCALVCLGFVIAGPGALAIWAVALLGFFHSIMFPTIFALSIKNLGRFTKLGSSLLVASIIGGAVVPAVMGFISDHSSIRWAFMVPLICQAYVLYFGLSGYKPVRTGAPVAVGQVAE
jgi:FHS family L-fucose permease-like MFS transporter